MQSTTIEASPKQARFIRIPIVHAAADIDGVSYLPRR